MATETELLAAVFAHPDEDTPRLAFAVWLDETGDPAKSDRAEFIRLQIEQENHPDGFLPPPARVRMELAGRHREAWVPKLPKGFEAWGFHRGFVERVKCKPGSFRYSGDELPRLMPFRGVLFRGPTYDLAGVAASPLLARVRSLSVSQLKLTTDQLLKLCRSPHLTGLVELGSQSNNHDDDAVVQLAGCERLSGLRKLELGSNYDITAAGAAALADSPHLGSLRDLDLGDALLGSEGLVAVVRGRVMRTLTSLAVWRCGIRPDGVEALAASADFRLAHLDLSLNPIGTRGAAALAQCSAANSLRVLKINECDFGASGAVPLGKSRAFGGLRELRCEKNALGRYGAMALFAHDAFGGLWELHLSDNAIGDAGAAAVANAAGDELHKLWLSSNEIGDAGVTALAGSPRLRNVRSLNLCNNRIGDAGAVALAQSPYLTNVEWLNVRKNPIGAAGARALAESPHLTPGQAISLDCDGVPWGAQSELRERFPGRLDFRF